MNSSTVGGGRVHSILPTLHFQSLSLNSPHRRTLLSLKPNSPLFLSTHSTPTLQFQWGYRTLQLKSTPKFKIRSSAQDNSEAAKWLRWVPKEAVAEKVLRLISSATSSPICQYVSSPTTFLHTVDPRIKLIWLLALVILPARSPIFMRFGLVAYLALLSIWILPKQLWMDQLGRVGLLSGILFIMLGLGSDGAPALVQIRTPPPIMTGLPSVPISLEGYSYIVMKLGPLQLTRKGLSLASTSASLTFTIFQSASLCLATTTPEQLASALRWFMLPLTVVGVPVAEISLTLLLSLRFVNLVFDEVRNAALGIVARRINWKQLKLLETVDIFVMYVRRIFKNIFSHAEQISQAMIVRGFRGDSDTHKIYFHSNPSHWLSNVISLLFLLGLIGAAVLSEMLLGLRSMLQITNSGNIISTSCYESTGHLDWLSILRPVKAEVWHLYPIPQARLLTGIKMDVWTTCFFSTGPLIAMGLSFNLVHLGRPPGLESDFSLELSDLLSTDWESSSFPISDRQTGR